MPTGLNSIATESSSIPNQVIEVNYVTSLLAEISDYWDYSYNDSSEAIPTTVGFALRTAYVSGIVPQMFFRWYDTSNNQLGIADTVNNASNFQMSNNSGLTWVALGTIPNVPGTTRLRYVFTTPPGVDIRVGLAEK